MSLISVLGRLRQADLWEFEVSFFYIGSELQLTEWCLLYKKIRKEKKSQSVFCIARASQFLYILGV